MLIQDLQVVLKVAEFKSITGAAESLDMSTATASAAVKRVERTLGVELFIRTTRQLRLSAAGERYLPNCEQALEMLSKAEQGVKDDLDIVDGEIRLAVPSDLGRTIVLPWLDEFMAEHSGVSLKLHVSDSNIDFYRDPVDIALRYGSMDDSSLYGFKICDVPGVLCASPDYLKRNGVPKKLDEVTEHNALLYQVHDVIHDTWEFVRNGEHTKIKVSGNRATNDAELVRRWCVAGKGFAAKSILDMSQDLFDKKLQVVLPEYRLKCKELWLVCPSRQSITPAMRILRDTLKENCEMILKQLEDRNILG